MKKLRKIEQQKRLKIYVNNKFRRESNRRPKSGADKLENLLSKLEVEKMIETG